MNRLYLLMVFLTVFWLILYLTPLRLRLRYRRKGRNDEFSMELFLWGSLSVYRFEIPFIKLKKPGLKAAVPGPGTPVLRVLRPAFKIRTRLGKKNGRPIVEEKTNIPGLSRMMSALIKQIRLHRRYRPALYPLLRKTSLRRLDWQTELGTGEPAWTGFLIGALWGIKGLLLSYFYALLAPGGKRPRLAIRPSFAGACFNVSIDCILEFRLAYLFFAWLRTIVLKIRG